MRIAYLDCFSGLSGDMLVGALLDSGLPFDDLKSALQTLPLKGYHLEAEEAHLAEEKVLMKKRCAYTRRARQGRLRR